MDSRTHWCWLVTCKTAGLGLVGIMSAVCPIRSHVDMWLSHTFVVLSVVDWLRLSTLLFRLVQVGGDGGLVGVGVLA